MSKRLFEKMLIKNLLSIMLPCIMILIVLICAVFKIADLNNLECVDADSEKEAIKMFAKGSKNFKLDTEQLKYTGFDSTADGKTVGKYYYKIIDGRMYLYLIDDKLAEKLSDDEIISGSIKFSMVEDNATAAYITGEFAETLGISYGEAEGFCSPYIFSNTDYPMIQIVIIKSLSALLIVLLITSIIITFTGIIHTDINPMASGLKKYGVKKDVIEELNGQLLNHVVYEHENIFVTDDYLIISYISKTDVIKLDYIKYLSKHVEIKKRGLLKPVKIFRLTASDPDRLYYECDFLNEQIIDEVIACIRGE